MLGRISGLLLIAAVIALGCASESGQQKETDQKEATKKEEAKKEESHDHEHEDSGAEGTTTDFGTYFGSKVSPEGAIPFDQMITQLNGKDSIDVKVRAKVDAVCQKKGCWMNVTSAKKSAPDSLFVRFKDYGFFVPKDISGREVVMQGKAFKEVTPVDELRHYAKDAGKSEEEIQKITEPKEETKFLATGVLLLPEESSKSMQ